jgi:prepilin-type processing-associated H-X9-DG protein
MVGLVGMGGLLRLTQFHNLSSITQNASVWLVVSQRSKSQTLDYTMRQDRRAFTVVELLAVFAIIGVLVALTVSAVLSSRERARRISCENNLRQIGLAVEAYTATHGSLPCNGTHGWRYLSRYVDGQPSELTEPFAFGEPCLPDAVSPCVDYGPWQRPAAYVCPSDSLAAFSNRGVHYRFNGGSLLARPNGVCSGPSGEIMFPRFTYRDVTDGLSSTALVSEKLLSLWATTTTLAAATAALSNGTAASQPLRVEWSTSLNVNPDTNLIDFVQECELRHQFPLHPSSFLSFDYQVMPYFHISPPNRRDCSFDRNTAAAASSEHGSGVSVLFCDGHVEKYSNQVDARVWQAIGSRDGGES